MRFEELLIYSLIFSFCLGQLGRLSFFGGAVNVYVWDAIVALLLIVWLLRKFLVEQEFKLPPFWLPLVTFSLIALISLINGSRWLTGSEVLVSAGYWFRWIAYAGVYFVVNDLIRKMPNAKRQMANALVLSSMILAILGFIQLAVFPDLSELDPPLGWDPHKNRLVSTWLDPNFLGAYFVLCVSLLIGNLFFLLQGKKDSRGSEEGFSRMLSLVAVGCLLIAGLLLTFSRSAWGMFAVVLGVFGILKSRKLLFLMVLMFFSAYFFVPRVQTRISGITDPADSAHFRLISWQRTFEIIKKYPVLGVGFNAFRYAQERAGFFRTSRGVPVESGHAGSGSDSSILLVWATTGAFGLLSYLWLCGSIIWRSFKQYRNNKLRQVTTSYNKFLSLALLAALLGLAAESNFINSLFYPPILFWIWIMVGLVL